MNKNIFLLSVFLSGSILANDHEKIVKTCLLNGTVEVKFLGRTLRFDARELHKLAHLEKLEKAIQEYRASNITSGKQLTRYQAKAISEKLPDTILVKEKLLSGFLSNKIFTSEALHNFLKTTFGYESVNLEMCNDILQSDIMAWELKINRAFLSALDFSGLNHDDNHESKFYLTGSCINVLEAFVQNKLEARSLHDFLYEEKQNRTFKQVRFITEKFLSKFIEIYFGLEKRDIILQRLLEHVAWQKSSRYQAASSSSGELDISALERTEKLLQERLRSSSSQSRFLDSQAMALLQMLRLGIRSINDGDFKRFQQSVHPDRNPTAPDAKFLSQAFSNLREGGNANAVLGSLKQYAHLT